MKIFGPIGMVLAAVGIWLAPYPAEAAGKYDGSVPFVCAAIAVTECGAEGECQRRTAESVNLPPFVKVDVKAMKVRAEEKGRESSIKHVEHMNGKMILHGAELERAWILTIHEETGKVSGVVSADGEGYVIFGACTLP